MVYFFCWKKSSIKVRWNSPASLLTNLRQKKAHQLQSSSDSLVCFFTPVLNPECHHFIYLRSLQHSKTLKSSRRPCESAIQGRLLLTANITSTLQAWITQFSISCKQENHRRYSQSRDCALRQHARQVHQIPTTTVLPEKEASKGSLTLGNQNILLELEKLDENRKKWVNRNS